MGAISGFNTYYSTVGTGTVGATFTMENNDVTNLVGADQQAVQAAAGNVRGSFTSSGTSTYLVGIATFKAAAGDTLGGAMQLMLMRKMDRLAKDA